MHFAKELYISEKLLPNKKTILRNIKYGKGFSSYFLIYNDPETNKIECMKSHYFRQKYYSCRPFLIEGVFASHDEALEYMAKKVALSMGVIYDDK